MLEPGTWVVYQWNTSPVISNYKMEIFVKVLIKIGIFYILTF